MSERDVFIWCQPRPHCKGVEVPVLPSLGFPSIYSYTLCRRTTKFDAATQIDRKGLVLGGQPRPRPKEAERRPIALQFWVFSIFMPIPFNAEQPRSARTYGDIWGGACLWGQARLPSAPIPRGGAQRSSIFGFSSIYVYALRRKTIEFGVVTHTGRGLFLEGQTRPWSQGGRGHSGCPILCVLSTIRTYTVSPRTTKCGMVT